MSVKRQNPEGMHIDWSSFQDSAKVLRALATAISSIQVNSFFTLASLN